jgi:D-3-phosphoglycerate dehydrogenase
MLRSESRPSTWSELVADGQQPVVSIIHDSFGSTPAAVIAQISRPRAEVGFKECRDDSDILMEAKAARILWLIGGGVSLSAHLLESLPRCIAIVRSGSGVDNIDVAAATALGILVVNTPRATDIPVAEGTVAMILALHFGIPLHDRDMRRGGWDRSLFEPASPLNVQTLGLIGFGRIARAVTARLLRFNMRMLAFDPYVAASEMAEHHVEKCELDFLMKTSDVISIHCPLSDATRNLVNEEMLLLLKPTSILVNTSRGEVVDEGALLDALRTRRIVGAALDVFATEPLPQDHPFRFEPNVILSPHRLGQTGTSASEFRRLGATSILDIMNGIWPESCVNKGQVRPRIRLRARQLRTEHELEGA